MKSILFVTLFLFSACYAQNYVRFINAAPETLTITTDTASNVTLTIGQVSTYTQVTGTLHVTSVMLNGTNLLGNISEVINVNGYSTVAAVFKNGSFYLVIYYENSTIPAMQTGSVDKSFVRLIDLAASTDANRVALNANGSPVVQYVGFLENTNFYQVDANATLTITSANGGTITVASLSGNSNVYTVFLVDNGSSLSASINMDRNIPLAATTALTSGMGTSGMATSGKSTSGMGTSGVKSTSGVAGTSGVKSTSGMGSTSGSKATTGLNIINPQTSNAVALSAGIALCIVALAF